MWEFSECFFCLLVNRALNCSASLQTTKQPFERGMFTLSEVAVQLDRSCVLLHYVQRVRAHDKSMLNA